MMSSATTCVVVGAGPAGAMLALLLARAGIDVTLLEARSDFDREFRGDTLHPSVLELMEQLGLADRLDQLPHTKLHGLALHTPEGLLVPADLRHLASPYPYVMLAPQPLFLQLLADEAARCSSFRLVMGASVRRLVEDDGRVAGVRYRSRDGWHEVRARLTVGTDGRSSKVRALAGLRLETRRTPMDALWLRVPSRPDDPVLAFGRVSDRQVVGAFRRPDHWQVGVLIRKGSYGAVRERGLPALRRSVAAALPELAARLETLTDWRQLSLLDVEAGRVRRWHRAGLLLIGDAAHPMSPAGGVGINYAISDAVAAANVLVGPLLEAQLRATPVPERALAAVQRRRVVPTRFIQAVQVLVERGIGRALAGRPVAPPLARRVLGLPVVRGLVARLFGIGLWRERVRTL